jgi:hypothetical protein
VNRLDPERLLDNAATCSQEQRLLRSDDDEEGDLRECVRLAVYEPMAKEVSRLAALFATAVRLIDESLEGERAEAIAFYDKHKEVPRG